MLACVVLLLTITVLATSSSIVTSMPTMFAGHLICSIKPSFLAMPFGMALPLFPFLSLALPFSFPFLIALSLLHSIPSGRCRYRRNGWRGRR